MGEDMIASQLVLPAGHRLRPVDLGAIAACGHATVRVSRRPQVAILPTGSELIPVGQPVKPGEIIEFNSLVLAGQVNAWGGLATRFPISPDDFKEIRQQVMKAAQNFDLILLNAGSSAGSEDYSAAIVKDLGDLLVHGIAIRPGHPVILGLLQCDIKSEPGASDQGTSWVPIIGVPGYPVSAALTGEIFIEPLLAKWLGRQSNNPARIKATLTRKVNSPAGDDDYVRVAVGQVEDRILAAPLPRGAG
jgi:putative molybdopterin biosynthesis protein